MSDATNTDAIRDKVVSVLHGMTPTKFPNTKFAEAPYREKLEKQAPLSSPEKTSRTFHAHSVLDPGPGNWGRSTNLMELKQSIRIKIRYQVKDPRFAELHPYQMAASDMADIYKAIATAPSLSFWGNNNVISGPPPRGTLVQYNPGERLWLATFFFRIMYAL